jgi:hypothetical protein
MLRIVEKSVPTHQMLPLPLTRINRVKKNWETLSRVQNSSLCTYDLYGPMCNAFDAGSIQYEGK